MAGTVRQFLVAIYQATVPAGLDWPQGPLPLALGSVKADTAARSSYYPPRAARLLYGQPGRPCRWHKELKVQEGKATIVALEALRLGQAGVLLVHFVAQDIIAAARALAGRDATALNGFDVRQLAPELEIVSTRPYTLAFVTPARRLPRLYSSVKYPRWPATDQWLWALASCTDRSDYPPDLVALRRDDQVIRMSADWSSLVLRDGMAFVGTRADLGDRDSFYGHAALYVRSIYADAITVGLLQLQGITTLENTLASIVDIDADESLDLIERQLVLFRHRLWWQHLSTHGVPNQMLMAFHRQHRLSERFAQILAEISDLNRLHHDEQSRHINNSAVLFTVITVPVGIGIAVLQALGHPNSTQFIITIAACLTVSLLVLLTRPGRMVIRSVRRRFSSPEPG